MSITLDLRANVSTDLWTTTAGLIHPINGGIISRWDDNLNSANRFETQVGGEQPQWNTSPTGLLLPAADFTSVTTDEVRNDTGNTLGNYIATNAYDMLVAFCATGITGNSANTWTNPALLGETGGFFGMFLKTGFVQGYNWDGNNDTVNIAISTNTPYVARLRHDTGNLYLSINGGSESSVASGNTASTTGLLQITNTAAGTYFVGRVVLASTANELGSVYTQMIIDWVTGASAAPRHVLTMTGVGA